MDVTNLAWNDNPTAEERLAWFVRLFELCQVAAAAEALEKNRVSLLTSPLVAKRKLLGEIWRAMELAYARRPGSQLAFNFVHRLTTKAILTRHLEGIPRIDADLGDPMRYFHSFDKANGLLRLAGDKSLTNDVRLSLVAFANLLLKEGMMQEVVDQLMAFVRAGRDFANEQSASAFVDSEYLVDGKNILLSSERGSPVPHVILRRIRNAIGHGRFTLAPKSSVVTFTDVDQHDPLNVYECQMTLDGFWALTGEIYLRISVMTAYIAWLLLWTMTGVDVLVVFDLATYRVHDDMV